MIASFKGFLTQTNALALAIGVIIGAAVGGVISALVADILMPIIGLALPGGDWRNAKLILRTTIDAAGKTTESAILYGHFLGTLVDFVAISFVVFLIVKALIERTPAPKADVTKQCPECLEVIPIAARRCRACATTVA